ncbi:unnamed protein product [Symbiodinium sp. CCMP2592]|nr:unnamed protein product [Symbiodinium sp. CCMP2592]
MHMAWDGDMSIRTRLRGGGMLLHEKSGLSCDNHVCKLNRSVLEPILMGMASSAERKLPSLGDLRNEMQIIYRSNNRVGDEVQASVAGDAIHIRKLLSHVKAKVRRHEVDIPPLTKRDQFRLKSNQKDGRRPGRRSTKKKRAAKKGNGHSKCAALSPSKRRRRLLRSSSRGEVAEKDEEPEAEEAEAEAVPESDGLWWYLYVDSQDEVTKIIADFTQEADFKDGMLCSQFKADLKARVDDSQLFGMTMYWTRPAVGLLHRTTGIEIGQVSIGKIEATWAAKMAALGKAASLYAAYIEGLIKDGYVEDTATAMTESYDIFEMKEFLKKAVISAIA